MKKKANPTAVLAHSRREEFTLPFASSRYGPLRGMTDIAEPDSENELCGRRKIGFGRLPVCGPGKLFFSASPVVLCVQALP